MASEPVHAHQQEEELPLSETSLPIAAQLGMFRTNCAAADMLQEWTSKTKGPSILNGVPARVAGGADQVLGSRCLGPKSALGRPQGTSYKVAIMVMCRMATYTLTVSRYKSAGSVRGCRLYKGECAPCPGVWRGNGPEVTLPRKAMKCL